MNTCLAGRERAGARGATRLASGILALLLLGAAPAATRAMDFDAAPMAGFTVLTAEDGRMTARNMIVVEYEGPVAFPMAENLRALWGRIRQEPRFEKVVLRLNSKGGSGDEGEAVVAVLQEMRDLVLLTTLVGDNDVCASMCVGLFIQGEQRYASPASSWMFHGASSFMSNMPDAALTGRYLDLFRERSVGLGLIDFLDAGGYLAAPGGYWMSGAELAQRSDVVTTVLPNWRPADPQPGLPGTLPGGV